VTPLLQHAPADHVQSLIAYLRGLTVLSTRVGLTQAARPSTAVGLGAPRALTRGAALHGSSTAN